MIGTIAITVLCILCFEAQFRTDSFIAANGDRTGYLAQTPAGPEPAGQRLPEAAAPPSQGKTQDGTGREQTPAAPSKGGPLKPFDPTEKVKADQAIDFPADI